MVRGMLETSARLLRLLSLLQARREWSGPELAERLEVGTRTIRRDVERLRRLGYPVEATPGVAGGYRLGPGADVPPLLLDEEEAVAVAVGLRTAASVGVAGIEETSVRALAKLERVMPSRLRRRVNALGSATVPYAFTGPAVDAEALAVIAATCRDHERLRFRYRSHDGAGSRRLVEPHRLVHTGRRWYLVAWDADRADWRTFRVDRIDGPASTGARFHPRELPAKDAAEFVSRSLQSYPSRYEARVTVQCPAAELQGRRWLGGDITPLGEHRCELRTSDDGLDWLAMRIAMITEPYEVDGPPELLDRLRAIGAGVERAVSGGRAAAG
jgi:predicted DNA-binding transcriptional regulator YafY